MGLLIGSVYSNKKIQISILVWGVGVPAVISASISISHLRIAEGWPYLFIRLPVSQKMLLVIVYGVVKEMYWL